MFPKLDPHQLDALNRMKNGCILNGGTGTGKSRTALAYYRNNETFEDIYVITTAKKRDSLDWEKEAAGFGISVDGNISVAGALTVDSWNNLAKYEDVEGAFFIFDEQRLVGSGAWTYSFLKIAKKNQWIMLSATPGDTWLDYIPVFVANGFYKNRTEFKREHVIYSMYSKFPKVDRYTGVGKLVRLRNSILVDMPFTRATVRNLEILYVDHDQELLDKVIKKRWHVYENRPLRDAAELYSVMRKVVNSDVSRLETVRSLMEQHPRLIVFYNFDYELDLLRTLAASVHSPKQCKDEKCELNQETESSSPKSKSSYPSKKVSPTSSEQQFKPCLICPSQSTQSGIQCVRSKKTAEDGNTTAQPKCSPSLSSSIPVHIAEEVSKQSSKTPSTKPSYMVKELESHRESSAAFPDGPINAASTKGHTGYPSRHTDVSIAESLTKTACRCQKRTNEISETLVREWNGHKHEELPESERWIYLVQYVAGSEAWDCILTNRTIFYSQTYSYKNFEQAQGRTDRMNTPYIDLYYYILRSRTVIDDAIWNSLKAKKSFNERKTDKYFGISR